MQRDDIRTFTLLYNQLRSLKSEIDTLSGRSPEAPEEALSAPKLATVVRLLTDTAVFLAARQHPLNETTDLGENATNSDAAVVAAQYVVALEALRAEHVKKRHGKWYWVVEPPAGTKGETEYLLVTQGKIASSDE